MKNLHADRNDYTIKSLCALAGKSKQAYYKTDDTRWIREAVLESFVVEFVLNVRKLDPRIGGKKLWLMYKREFPFSERLGRDKFIDILHRNNLKIRDKKRKPRTTDSGHGLPTYPNLVKAFIPTVINQLWVSDITYIPIFVSEDKYKFAYLSLISDTYNHEIIGWYLGSTLETVYSLKALEMAMSRRLDGLSEEELKGLIHHSDRGVQYASREYVEALGHIRISMTENGDPKENAMAERINNTIKNELFAGIQFSSIEEARKELEVRIRFYNEERPHMSLDMMTPSEAAKCTGELKKRWHSYREAAIKDGRLVG